MKNYAAIHRDLCYLSFGLEELRTLDYLIKESVNVDNPMDARQLSSQTAVSVMHRLYPSQENAGWDSFELTVQYYRRFIVAIFEVIKNALTKIIRFIHYLIRKAVDRYLSYGNQLNKIDGILKTLEKKLDVKSIQLPSFAVSRTTSILFKDKNLDQALINRLTSLHQNLPAFMNKSRLALTRHNQAFSNLTKNPNQDSSQEINTEFSDLIKLMGLNEPIESSLYRIEFKEDKSPEGFKQYHRLLENYSSQESTIPMKSPTELRALVVQLNRFAKTASHSGSDQSGFSQWVKLGEESLVLINDASYQLLEEQDIDKLTLYRERLNVMERQLMALIQLVSDILMTIDQLSLAMLEGGIEYFKQCIQRGQTLVIDKRDSTYA